MADITMPKLSDTMTEGTLVAWKKKPGEAVSMGEVIAEVETDKATMEMEAFEDGTLAEIFVQEGQKVEVGQKIARIGVAGEEEAPAPGAAAAPKPGAGARGNAEKAKVEDGSEDAKTSFSESSSDGLKERESAEAKLGTATPAAPAALAGPASDPDHRVKASPLARKLAKEHGVDLTGLRGTGPGERIVQADVLAAVESRKNGQPTAATAAAAPTPKPAPTPVAPIATAPRLPAPAPVPVTASAADQRVPLTSMRRTIADRLLQSKTTIPHFYLRLELDAAPLTKLRAEINAGEGADGNKFSVNDFILKAAVSALRRHPKVNASFQGDAVVQFGSVNLAVAVAVEDGLVTPVIRNAQAQSLRDISIAVKDLASRARAKKLKPEEYQGGTFTVSNLGAYGIENFDAIINPPQAAILSVGALVKKPVVNGQDEIVVGHRIAIGLSCDHRVVDGAIGAEFLATLRKMIENPMLMLV